jgi:hypothetical protein
MTDQTTGAAIAATANTAAADIKADAHALIAKIDDTHASGEASTWLANAKSAIESAIQYVEAHFQALEAKIEGDTKDPAPVSQAAAPAAAPAADPAAASTDAPAADTAPASATAGAASAA